MKLGDAVQLTNFLLVNAPTRLQLLVIGVGGLVGLTPEVVPQLIQDVAMERFKENVVLLHCVHGMLTRLGRIQLHVLPQLQLVQQVEQRRNEIAKRFIAGAIGLLMKKSIFVIHKVQL
jgi:hypothetical protein